MMPKIQVSKDPQLTSQDFSSSSVYGTPTRLNEIPPPPPALNLHVGPDFANVLKYLNKLVTLTTLPPVATPTAVVPPVVVPSPTTTSTMASVPPVATPAPGTTDPVVLPPSSVPTFGPSPDPGP